MNVLVRPDNLPVAIHPDGFRVSDHRKAIPLKIKLDVVIRWEGKCAHCSERLGSLEDTEFDHDPALIARPWDAEARDFIPAQIDPAWIAPRHRDCHRVKSCGRKGTKRSTSAGSDVGTAGKIRRLTASQIEFRAKLLAKDGVETPDPTNQRPKKKWPSRPFPRKPKPTQTRKATPQRTRP